MSVRLKRLGADFENIGRAFHEHPSTTTSAGPLMTSHTMGTRHQGRLGFVMSDMKISWSVRQHNFGVSAAP